jgi:transposase-like protein
MDVEGIGRGSLAKRQFVSATPYVVDITTISTPPQHEDPSFLHQKFIVERLSAAQIAREIGCCKTTVKKYLRQYQIKKGLGNGRHHNKLALGEKFEKGRLKDHQQELRLVETLKKMHVEENLSTAAIAKILNSMKVPTKKRGKKWDHSVVRRILQRLDVYKAET